MNEGLSQIQVYNGDLTHLEQTVANTGSQLYIVANKLHQVEQHLNIENEDEVDELYVMELLESMTEVKNEYQNLQKDLKEVQQLQRDVTTSLRCQMRNMQRTFQSLKQRIEITTKMNNGTGKNALMAQSSSKHN